MENRNTSIGSRPHEHHASAMEDIINQVASKRADTKCHPDHHCQIRDCKLKSLERISYAWENYLHSFDGNDIDRDGERRRFGMDRNNRYSTNSEYSILLRGAHSGNSGYSFWNLKDELLNNSICTVTYHVLESEFSETFRRIKDESDEYLKTRHKHFAISGRLLRQLVEYFGESIGNKPIGSRCFYHGVQKELAFTVGGLEEVQIYSPLSTSKSFQVAANFAQSRGLIVTFNVDDYKFLCDDYTPKAAYFPIDWLSDYPCEREYFFVGGTGSLQIENIMNYPDGIMDHIYALKLLSDALSSDVFAQIVTTLVMTLINLPILIERIIATTLWDKVVVFNRSNPNSDDAATLAMSKADFMDALYHYVQSTDVKSMHFIPMNATSSVWIVRIFDNMDIGISLNLNHMNDIKVTAIYLDADTIRKELKISQQKYPCLDEFESCIDELVIIDVSDMTSDESESMYSQTDYELWSDDESNELDEKMDFIHDAYDKYI